MYAVSCTFAKLSLVWSLYMSESITAKELECSKGQFPTKVDLVWGCFGIKGVGEGAVFDPGHMSDGLRPKRNRKGFGLEDLSSISNHQLSEIVESPVCMFRHTIFLWCIGIGKF